MATKLSDCPKRSFAASCAPLSEEGNAWLRTASSASVSDAGGCPVGQPFVGNGTPSGCAGSVVDGGMGFSNTAMTEHAIGAAQVGWLRQHGSREHPSTEADTPEGHREESLVM